MEAVQFVLIVVSLLLPFHLTVQWQLERLSDPRQIRASGAAIDQEQELEARSSVIGHYQGHEIYDAVQFMGMRYRFDRVSPHWYRHYVAQRELFVEPGLVYVTD